MQHFSHEALRRLVFYSPETGVFTWLVDRLGPHGKPTYKTAGTEAGCIAKSNGYRVIGILGRRFYAHRLAFYYMTGAWPSFDIDHIDGDKTNNSWKNLRDVSKQVNNQNIRRKRRGVSPGLLGAHWNKKDSVWVAQICVNGRSMHVGSFSSEQEAHAAYVHAKRVMHDGCTL